MTKNSEILQEMPPCLGYDSRSMRTSFLLLLACALLVLGACTPQQPQPAQQAAAPPAVGAEPQYRTEQSTIKDLMDGIVDPSADYVWDSVATIVSAAGTDERRPRTDEEWTEVRRNTIRLLEATNMLQIPGRHVARPGQKAEDPNIELTPEKIEENLNADRASWNKHAGALYDATIEVYKAIDKKDPEGILLAGDGIDQACEQCHLQYWYPNDAARQNALVKGISQETK